MKATMDQAGVITLEPETGAEAHALKKWTDANLVKAGSISVEVRDGVSGQLVKKTDIAPEPGSAYWRFKGLIVSTTEPDGPKT